VHRLAEDILDPNRNVDGTFRQVLVETNTGQVFAGVNLRQTPAAVTLTDAAAKDVTIARADIRSQTTSPLSLMPPAFEQTIAEKDFADLLAYLLVP
jgi:putative heme-binding domain-containing protein